MQSERVEFTNESGHELVAKLDLPLAGEPVAYALFAHCFTCTKNLKAVSRITTRRARHRHAPLRLHGPW